MQKINHANVKTNVHIRAQFQKSSMGSNSQLAFRFNLSTQTVSKWKTEISFKMFLLVHIISITRSLI